jgi:hypothetical protein
MLGGGDHNTDLWLATSKLSSRPGFDDEKNHE